MDSQKEELREWAKTKASGHYRRTCPYCSEARRNRTTHCLSVEIDDDKALYQCWHCQARGGISLRERPRYDYARKVLPSQRPTAGRSGGNRAVKQVLDALDSLAKNWLKTRGISEDTANVYGCVGARGYFPDLQREGAAIAFPYCEDDATYGHKVRCVEAKANICDTPLRTLCGLQCVDTSEENHLVICEGEPDMLSFAEAGVMNAVSVPNGASSFTAVRDDADERAKLGFLWSAKEVIEKVGRVYIATDADDPGEKLAEELARRIGRHRCWRVFYPDGCKDANDVLNRHGGEVLAACVHDAEPWPVAGLYEAARFFDDVRELFAHGFEAKVKTGLDPVDEIYSMQKGLLTVVTGIPSHGKSTFIDQLMLNAAKLYGHTFAVCSFENPIHVHIGKLCEMLTQKHFFPTELPGDRMKTREMENVLPFIHDHFKFLKQDDGAKADIDSIIERIKSAVFRWGIRGAVIDPYNYIARPSKMDSETQWIDDLLTRIRLTAEAYDLHIWFVAHPTKLNMDSDGNYPPPRGYSISGSAAWYSKADFGLTVYKEGAGGTVRIINWKTRFAWLGKEGECQLLWDNVHHGYLNSALEMAPSGELYGEVKGHGSAGYGQYPSGKAFEGRSGSPF